MKQVGLGVSAVVFLGFSLIASDARAQATRTWVSGVGDDINPCSRTAPCKTFPGAINKTAAKGEINVLDAGTYGSVSIFKSISIEADENFAGVLNTASNGILVNVAAGDVVVLRGLTIEGLGTGLNGIRFIGSGTLIVENCTINNFSQKGISFEPAGAGKLFVKDTVIRNNQHAANGGGIFIKPGVGGTAAVTIDGVRMENNTFGLRAEDNSMVDVRNSVASGNSTNGFLAVSISAPAELTIENSMSVHNGTNGVKSEGNNALVRISNMTISHNGTGLSATLGGDLLSFQNNRNDGNGLDGAPTGNISQQ